VEENGERVPAGLVTLASVLQARGYKTAAFIGSDFLDKRFGLDQGFGEYDSPFSHTSAGGLTSAGAGLKPGATPGVTPGATPDAPARMMNPQAMSLRRDGALVVRAALQWLEAQRGPQRGDLPGAKDPNGGSEPRSLPPVFVFVHLFDLHVPYTLPVEVARKQGISRYDAQLQYVDQVMGHFQQELMRRGWWEASLVVVFGDHGEGLGDHQETDHGYYIYESTLRVPLIFHWPPPPEGRNSKIENGNSKLENGNSKLEIGNSKIENPVGLIDVAPTILDFLRVPAPASFAGTSQLGAIERGEPGRPSPVYSESLYAHDAFDWAPLRALRLGKYKYIQTPKAELYDLDADPRERANLLHKNAAMAAELQNELAQVLARYAPSEPSSPAALPPETLAELESLGYLAAAPRGTVASDGPDPKDRFAEFELYQTAFEASTGGHTAAAISKFQSILKTDPRNTLARFHLGEGYLRMKRPQDALREWETALRLDPQYAPAAEAIGQYWLEQGDFAKARRRFQQVVALTPESFTGHFLLAIADKRLGLLPEARHHLEAACRIAPRDENCARELKALGP
jgi:arylsulfatase A-like enzyme